MTEVLRSSPSHHFPSSPSSSSLSNDVSQSHQSPLLINHNRTSSFPVAEEEEEDSPARGEEEGEEGEEEDQLSLLDFFVTAFRKYLIACRSESEELCSMEIGWPTNVRHVAHVTFDRFNGFLGLPVEFEPEVPRRAPSASAHVFGVSTESMQCSYDNRGNSVPTILLMMQKRLYALGGLQAEGIFRINAENSQEEFVRDQLNSGVVPDGIDVHCLAGLIKAWFRELPTGVLDPLEPEQVMQCESEEECAKLVRLLPPTEAALLDWAINLMADVVQEEHQNKMNARNVAMVFAPNMTHMSDPLTALMYAVQVMNFLKLLIVRTLKEREDSLIDSGPSPRLEPSDENGHRSTAHPCLQEMSQEKEEVEQEFIGEKPILESPPHHLEDSTAESGHEKSQSSLVKLVPEENESPPDGCTSDVRTESAPSTNEPESASSGPKAAVKSKTRKSKNVQLGNSNSRRGGRKANGPVLVQVPEHAEKSKGISIVSRINSRTERIEAWR